MMGTVLKMLVALDWGVLVALEVESSRREVYSAERAHRVCI